MLSMTGFGKGEAECAGEVSFRIEINSVNRKQLEIRFAMPPELMPLESNARRIIGSRISRGAIQLRVAVNYSNAADYANSINTGLLEELAAAAAATRKKLGLPGEIAVESLMRIPGVVQQNTPDLERPGFVTAFEAALNAACDRFEAMRAAEGAALAADLNRRSELLENLLAEIERHTAGLPEVARKRLSAKIADAGLPIKPDDPALLKELLFYADKSDVTEEVTRLHSHFTQLKKFLNSNGPAGRSLDFLAQEFFREITTLGNKAAGPEISPLVVKFKSELEKMREQIQNVE